MRFVLVLTAMMLCCGLVPAASVPAKSSGSDLYIPKQKQIVDTKVRLPLVFEPNVGQAADGIQWISRTMDGTLLMTPAAATLVVQGNERESKRVTMRVVGGRQSAKAEPAEALGSYSNYFIGNDPSKWHTRVPHYSKIKYKNVYPGIDLLYYGTDRRLEYDFILSPGVSHSIIELAFDGADKLNVDRNGDLIVKVAGLAIRQFRPKVYQWIDGTQQTVEGAYRISRGDRVQFALGRYDRSQPLVIDPVLQYSTYVGGTGHERGAALAIDRSGAAYITGHTNSSGLRSAFRDQQNFAGKTDAMVAKLSSFSEAVEWISYFGGTEHDQPTGIDVDSTGNVLISGWTVSPDLPVRNAIQTTFQGVQDGFVAKFTPNGTDLVYATYFGGTCVDTAMDIAVDSTGNAYVVGFTYQTLLVNACPLPVVNAFQSGGAGGGGDVFVAKIPPTGSPLAYSTFVGGEGDDTGVAIAVDSRGAAYVAGHTTSSMFFPLMQPIQRQNRGARDTFLFKLVPAGNALEYSTFYGGARDDIAFGIAIDGSGNAYVVGTTYSSDFPVVNAVQSASRGGDTDAYVFKVNAAGSRIEYASYLGGDSLDDAIDVAVDAAGSAYLTGRTQSHNFPSTSPFQQAYGGGPADAFVARLAPDGKSLLYSTYLGGNGEEAANGIAVDAQGAVTLSGWTSSSDLPLARGSLNSGLSPGDVFVSRISADTSVTLIGATPARLTFSGGTGQNPAAQTIAIASTGNPLTFTAGANVPWVQVTADRTNTPATLTVSVVATGLPPGEQTAEILVNAPAAMNAPLRIPVTFNIVAVPVIQTVVPGSIPTGQETRITMTGTGFINNSQVIANNSPLQTTFVNATTLQATIPAVLAAGTNPLQLIVRNPDASSAAFSLPVGTATPSFAASGIVNAATWLPGAVAPGQLITISGRDFGPDRAVSAVADANGVIGTTLAETRVLFNSVPVPILSVSTNQVSAIVPSTLAPSTSSQVVVEYRGRPSQPVPVGIGTSAPGLFTANNSGTGQASALNENFSSNAAANPAARGSLIILYATGVGPLNPPVADGRITPPGTSLPQTTLPVAVDFNGVPGEVVFAGSSPGLLSSVVQINVRVPEGAAVGEAVPVQLTVGTAQGRTGVTIAIR